MQRQLLGGLYHKVSQLELKTSKIQSNLTAYTYLVYRLSTDFYAGDHFQMNSMTRDVNETIDESNCPIETYVVLRFVWTKIL